MVRLSVVAVLMTLSFSRADAKIPPQLMRRDRFTLRQAAETRVDNDQ
jgi:hypothetical protein